MLISYCSAIFNRAWMLEGLLRSMRELRGEWEWVVVDFESTDDPEQFLQDSRVKFRREKGPFWKTRGLNIAAEVAEANILFFVDVDLLLPEDFNLRILKYVYPGHAYYPIKYNLHRDVPPIMRGSSRSANLANGYWFPNGPGDAGFTREDFSYLGGWNEWFKLWGGEDGEMLGRARSSLVVARENCPNLFHRWHPYSVWRGEGKAFWKHWKRNPTVIPHVGDRFFGRPWL